MTMEVKGFTLEGAVKMLQAGANRLGTSSAVDIIT